MLGHTHILFGVATLTAAEAASRAISGEGMIQPHQTAGGLPAGPMLGLGAVVLGALAPDLDAEDSTIHHELGCLSWPIKIGMSVLGVKHRGVLHSGLALALVTVLAGALGWVIGFWDVSLAFALGYASHVAIADAMTLSGVPLWWPAKTRFHLLPRPFRVRTGGPAEKLVAVAVSALLLWLLPHAAPPAWLEAAQQWL